MILYSNLKISQIAYGHNNKCVDCIGATIGSNPTLKLSHTELPSIMIAEKGMVVVTKRTS